MTALTPAFENMPMAAAPGNMTMRQDFGGSEAVLSGETSSTAVAAQMQAQIQARYIMALRRPRDWMQVRDRLLKECQRPGFCQSALYAKPIGKGQSVTGFSIRFAEAALRCMTNVSAEVMTLYDDARKRLVRITLTDLESNVPLSADITVEKTVERRQLRQGQKALSMRANSYGDMVHLVEATEGDLLVKEGAQVSKALRNLALRLLPGDIQDDCKAQINTTLAKQDAADPAAARKKLADSFSGIGVEPKALAEYLGHDLAQLVPSELEELRMVYTAIKSGETTWREALDAKLPNSEGAEDPAEKEAGGRVKTLREKVSAKRAASQPAPSADKPPAEETAPPRAAKKETEEADPWQNPKYMPQADEVEDVT